MRSIVGPEIATVGRADLRHVIIIFAPCTSPPPRAMSRACLQLFAFSGFSFGAVDEKHHRRYADATLHFAPLLESVNSCETQACRGQSPPFLIQDEPRVREL
jgi:hypothetical protein